jgi:hypothetical protein
MTDNPYEAMRRTLFDLMQRVDDLERSQEDVRS